jgi:ATP/maltotriose-dependent transcriptional regulator MalT
VAIVSPVFAGRTSELGVLTEAFDRARAGGVAGVLLGGEAGGGKTRLIGEFTDRVRTEALVLTGGCVELGTAGLPYAPFTAVLRRLVRRLGADEVAALVPGGSGRELARLLPEFGAPAESGETGLAQARLFEQLLGLFENLAAKEPLALIVEDAHWADRSTRDLLAFLVRNLRDVAVLLIVSFRSDDLHREHPLRQVLAELGRVPWVTRVDLRRLSRAEVADQLAGILGHPPGSALVSRAYARAGGIPLFVEAMVDPGGRVVETLPESLRDLLLASVRRLPGETQRVLLAASASTSGISHGLLAAVTGLDEEALAAALRPAVTANILIADGDGYAYRHTLIGEALHEEFLPGEHVRTHRRFAEALERDPALARRGAAELALHWHCAHDSPRALAAAWQAAAESGRVYAYPERLKMLERVLELWDQVPDAAERIGADRLDVLESVAGAAFATGEPARGLAVVDGALAEVDSAREPERVARLLVLRAILRKRQGRSGVLDDYRAAERLLPEPTAARARVLNVLGGELILLGRIIEGLPFVAEAFELARRHGDEFRQIDVLLTLAIGHHDLGDNDTALREFEEARRRAERLGTGRLLPRTLLNLSDYWNILGEHERAAEVAREGITQARQAGRTRSEGVYSVVNLAEAQIALGSWDEALESLDRLSDGLDLPAGLAQMALRLRAEIAVGRGESEHAADLIGRLRDMLTGDEQEPQYRLAFAELFINWRLGRGDADGAIAATEEALWGHRLPDGPRSTWPVLAAGMRACAADPGGRPELRERLLEVAGRLEVHTAVQRAHELLLTAESERAGTPDGAATPNGAAADRGAGSFDAAAAAWRELKVPYQESAALLRAAEAFVRAGDRGTAAARLGRAVTLAGRLGAAPLRAEIETLARRARISLAGERADGRLGLTPRELEVLRLVTDGRSNRDIAEELFISVKTASVHVSNILGKLGVSGRGEAAATAHRLRLFE